MPSSQSSPPLYLFIRGQTSHRYQQSIFYLVEVIIVLHLVLSLDNKIQYEEQVPKSQSKHLEMSLASIIRSPTSRPSYTNNHYTYVQCLGHSHAISRVVGTTLSCCEDLSLGFLMMSLTPLPHIIYPSSLQQDSWRSS